MKLSSSEINRRFLHLSILVLPLIAFRVSDTVAVGAADILFLPGLMLLLFSRWRGVGFVEFVLLGFLGVLLVSQAVSYLDSEPRFSDIAFLRIFSIFLPFLLAARILEFDLATLKRIVSAFFWSGLLAISAGLAIYYLGIEIRTDQQRLWLGGGRGQELRAGGLLGNSGNYGHFVSAWAVIMISMHLAFEFRRASVRIVVVLIFALWALFLASSRAGLLHILVGVFIIVAFYTSVRFILFLLCAMLFISVSVAFLVNLDNFAFHFSLRRMDLFNLTGESRFFETPRFSNWSQLWVLFSAEPIFGIGYKRINSEYGMFSDNAFIGVAVEFGIFAATLYLLFWMALLIFFFRRALRTNKLAVAGLAIVVSEIAHALTLDTHTIWYSMPLVSAFIGLTYRACRDGRNLGRRLESKNEGLSIDLAGGYRRRARASLPADSPSAESL